MHEINHILGTCGETHPSLLSLILSGLGLTTFFAWVRWKWNTIISYFKQK